MELGTVATGSIIGMIFSFILAVGLPIVLIVHTMKKWKARFSSFAIGAGVFIVMAIILEQILHSIVFRVTGDTITGNVWLYALYGGLAAAVFEETGRFLAMNFIMKKNLDGPNAFMYGVGHGGIEAIVIIGLAEVSNIISSIMINSGGIEATLALLDPTTKETTLTQLSALWTTPSYQFYIAGIERVFAIALQICFSLIIYYAITSGKKYLVLVAYGIHFAVDAVTVVISSYTNMIVTEIAVAVMVAAVIFMILQQKKKME